MKNFYIFFLGNQLSTKLFFSMSKNCFKELFIRIVLSTLSIIYFFYCGYIKKDLLMLYLLGLTCIKHEFQSLDHFIFTDVTEILYTYLTILIFLSTKLAIFFTFYHFVSFFFSGLRVLEKSFFRFSFVLINFIFIISFIFVNKILFPHCWYFFMDYSQSQLFKGSKLFLESKVKDCVNLYIQTFYLTFCNCVVFFLVLKKTPLHIVKKRKYSIIMIVFSALLVIPVDFWIQLFSVIIILIFHEMTYFFSTIKYWISVFALIKYIAQ